MASRLCRETQTSLCIKNPANITAIRKQQQQQLISTYLAPVCTREIFLFLVVIIQDIQEIRVKNPKGSGVANIQKNVRFLFVIRILLAIVHLYQDMYLVQSIYAIDSSRTFRIFFFFPLRELQKRIQGEHVLHSSGLLQEETPQKYSKYQNFCFTIKFDILLI